jgi:hypothetical protein
MVRRSIPARNIPTTTQTVDNSSKTVVSEGNMVGKPTVALSERVETRVIQNIQTDPYFSIKVSTAGATEAEQVILFDASGGFQFGANKVNGGNVVITGLSANYQYILNDISHNASYVDMLKMSIREVSGDCNGGCFAIDQYARPIEIYDSSKGSMPRLLKTIYPEQGVNESQFQLNINTFQSDLIITNRTAFTYMQEPDTIVTWGFYQVAELGRKQ